MTGTSLGKFALNVPASWVHRIDNGQHILGLEIHDNGSEELVIKHALIYDAGSRRDRFMTRREIRRAHSLNPQRSYLGHAVYVNRVHRMGHSQSRSFVVGLPTEWVERQLKPNETAPRYVICDSWTRKELKVTFERPDVTDEEDAAETAIP